MARSRVAHDGVARRVTVRHVEDGMVRPEFKKECDINQIVKRVMRTGAPLPVRRDPPLYGDFAALTDFQDAQSVLERAWKQFDGLGSSVRKKFGNDPAQMLAFVSDEKNRAEAVELGLIAKPVPEKIQKVEIVGGDKK